MLLLPQTKVRGGGKGGGGMKYIDDMIKLKQLNPQLYLRVVPNAYLIGAVMGIILGLLIGVAVAIVCLIA